MNASQALAADHAVIRLHNAHLFRAAQAQARVTNHSNISMLLAVATGAVPTFGLICDVIERLNQGAWVLNGHVHFCPGPACHGCAGCDHF